MKLKRIIGLLALAAVLAVPMLASADDGKLGIYLTPKAVYGAVYMNDVKYREKDDDYPVLGSEWDNTFGGSLAVGYDFSKTLLVRSELEYAIFTKAKGEPRSSEFQSYNIQTLFVNVYYDINTGTKFTPYVGAGIGAGFIKTEGRADFDDGGTGSKTVTNFAWNLGLGLGYHIMNNVVLDIGYRFADLGAVKTNWDPYLSGVPWRMETKRLYQHQCSIGARIGF